MDGASLAGVDVQLNADDPSDPPGPLAMQCARQCMAGSFRTAERCAAECVADNLAAGYGSMGPGYRWRPPPQPERLFPWAGIGPSIVQGAWY